VDRKGNKAPWREVEEAEANPRRCITEGYTAMRRHAGLGDLPPVEFEAAPLGGLA
jgi:hypothetical protein